jgi:hypothetical protein
MKLRMSFSRAQKAIVFLTTTAVIAIAVFVIGEILIFGIHAMYKKTLGQEVFHTYSIVNSGSEEKIKEYVRSELAKSSVDQRKEAKSPVFGKSKSGAIISVEYIMVKVGTGCLVAFFILVVGCIVYFALEILKKIFVKERKYERYDAQVMAYGIKAELEFKVINKDSEKEILSEKYPAVCKNVSAEGVCFTSQKKLQKGDKVYLEIYLSDKKDPIRLEGEVRWSHETSLKQKQENNFDSGVRLLTVEGKSIHNTIYYDQRLKIYWSIILETIFGSPSNLKT